MYRNTILLHYFIVNRLHGGMFMNLNDITKINKNLKKINIIILYIILFSRHHLIKYAPYFHNFLW